jgi:hypothetical protein
MTLLVIYEVFDVIGYLAYWPDFIGVIGLVGGLPSFLLGRLFLYKFCPFTEPPTAD